MKLNDLISVAACDEVQSFITAFYELRDEYRKTARRVTSLGR
jgi:hypothetical protein